jgi:hypothetical protein
MLAEYRRGGGRPPRDDESLEVETDGSYVLRRTVGGERVGHFAGEIPKRGLTALKRLVEAAEDLDDRPTGLPPHVTESVSTARADITMGVHAKASSPAAKLVKRLRQLVDDLTDEAVAAVELRVAADGSGITLASVGTEPVEVDFSAASLSFTLFGAREELLTEGDIAGPEGAGTKTRLEPGWTARSPIDLDDAFNPRRTLDVKVDFDLYDASGAMRRARLRAIAGKGWSA